MKRILFALVLSAVITTSAWPQTHFSTFGYTKPSLDRYGKPLPPRPYIAPDKPLGAGPYKAVMSEMAGLSQHVVYYPANLAALGDKKLPIVSWGNGGCVYMGNRFRDFLTQIASYGYVVISGGPMGAYWLESGPNGPNTTVAEQSARPQPAPAAAPVAAGDPTPKVTEAMMREAIDWAIKQNGDKASRLYGKLDTAHIAVMGQSCGGLYAETIGASDPRVTAVGIWNSGMFTGADKGILAKIHVPVILITGDDKLDIAHANGKDDYNYLNNAPVFYAWKTGGDHIGTYAEPDGGEAGKIAPAWLDWVFRNDATAAKMFVGADCTLCKDQAWHVSRKNIK